jgi:hypothetical protein
MGTNEEKMMIFPKVLRQATSIRRLTHTGVIISSQLSKGQGYKTRESRVHWVTLAHQALHAAMQSSAVSNRLQGTARKLNIPSTSITKSFATPSLHSFAVLYQNPSQIQTRLQQTQSFANHHFVSSVRDALFDSTNRTSEPTKWVRDEKKRFI